MHSSISSSELVEVPQATPATRGRIRLAIFTLIGLMVCVLLGAEILSRTAFPRISRIERRIRNDEANVRSIAAQASEPQPSVLLVGNSLLLRGLDYPRIRSELSSQAHVVRYVIENTEYLDWYYGLRHIFAAGVHPSIVVVCLNLSQTVSSNTLGEYSARHLFGPGEILAVAHDSGMDATHTSGLFFAHWSAFYSSRAMIRNFILNQADPPYAEALHHLVNSVQANLPGDDLVMAAAQARLRAMEELCRQSGVELILLIPPALGGRNGLLASAATLQKVDYDYPFAAGSLGPEFFRADHYHLNEKGAALFTEALSRYLQGRILSTKIRKDRAHASTRLKIG